MTAPLATQPYVDWAHKTIIEHGARDLRVAWVFALACRSMGNTEAVEVIVAGLLYQDAMRSS